MCLKLYSGQHQFQHSESLYMLLWSIIYSRLYTLSFHGGSCLSHYFLKRFGWQWFVPHTQTLRITDCVRVHDLPVQVTFFCLSLTFLATHAIYLLIPDFHLVFRYVTIPISISSPKQYFIIHLHSFASPSLCPNTCALVKAWKQSIHPLR